jgi:hypothetical protein
MYRLPTTSITAPLLNPAGVLGANTPVHQPPHCVQHTTGAAKSARRHDKRNSTTTICKQCNSLDSLHVHSKSGTAPITTGYAYVHYEWISASAVHYSIVHVLACTTDAVRLMHSKGRLIQGKATMHPQQGNKKH